MKNDQNLERQSFCLSFRSVHLIMIGMFVQLRMIRKRLDGGIMMMLFNIYRDDYILFQCIFILISLKKTTNKWLDNFYFETVQFLLRSFFFIVFALFYLMNICIMFLPGKKNMFIVHHTMLHEPFLFKIGIKRKTTSRFR